MTTPRCHFRRLSADVVVGNCASDGTLDTSFGDNEDGMAVATMGNSGVNATEMTLDSSTRKTGQVGQVRLI